MGLGDVGGLGGLGGVVGADDRPSQGSCRTGTGAVEGEFVATSDGFGGASLMVHLMCLPMIDAEVGEGPAPHL